MIVDFMSVWVAFLKCSSTNEHKGCTKQVVEYGSTNLFQLQARFLLILSKHSYLGSSLGATAAVINGIPLILQH